MAARMRTLGKRIPVTEKPRISRIRGAGGHLSAEEKETLATTALNLQKIKGYANTEDIRAALPFPLRKKAVEGHLRGLYTTGKLTRKRRKRPQDLTDLENKLLENTIRVAYKKNNDFTAQDAIAMLPKGFRAVTVHLVRDRVRAMVVGGEIVREKHATPGRGGRRTKIYDDPEWLIRLNSIYKTRPHLEGSPLAKALGLHKNAYRTVNALDENLNSAARYAKATGTPLEKVLRDFRRLRERGMV